DRGGEGAGGRPRAKPRAGRDGIDREGGLPRRLCHPRRAAPGGRPLLRRRDGDGSRSGPARQPAGVAAVLARALRSARGFLEVASRENGLTPGAVGPRKAARMKKSAMAVAALLAACSSAPPELLPPPFGPDGPSPPRLFFPTGLAQVPDGGALLVANGNFNRAFGSGTVVSVSRAYVDTLFRQQLDCDPPPSGDGG